MELKDTGAPADGERVETAAVALGLPGFVVLAAGEYGGEVELLVETGESVTGCPRCGVLATLHDRKPRWVRDLPLGGRPVVLVWFKRVWRCEERMCAQRTRPGPDRLGPLRPAEPRRGGRRAGYARS